MEIVAKKAMIKFLSRFLKIIRLHLSPASVKQEKDTSLNKTKYEKQRFLVTITFKSRTYCCEKIFPVGVDPF